MIAVLSALVVAAIPSPTIRVEGEGWLRLAREGRVVYAREARLHVEGGFLTAGSGARFLPPLGLASIEGTSVAEDGVVRVSGRTVGRLVLARFEPGANLKLVGEFFVATSRPITGSPGTPGFGKLVAGGDPAVRAPAPVGTTGNSELRTATSSENPVPATIAAGLVRVRAVSELPPGPFTLLALIDGDVPDPLKSALAQIRIGDVPPLGLETRVDRSALEARLRAARLTLRLEMPDRVLVRRVGQSIPHAQFLAAALEAIRAEAGPDAGLEDAHPLPPMAVNLGEVALRPGKVQASGRMVSVPVEVWVAGQRVQSRTVRGTVTGLPDLPRVGSTVTVRARQGGLRVEFSARVVAVRGWRDVEVESSDRQRFVGRVTSAGDVEIRI